ncbi:hypothetical protein HHI36_022970 [Cryptolaemus montrouzieri]|uniref:Uncharacterized protein n=1 Tax=Cryptolaemus montrouzieri TaxID=559131 RepID=A0ABD2PFE0_9CUCU
MKKLLAEKESQIFKLIRELESEKTTCLKQIQNIADLMNEKKLLNHHIEVMNKELSRLNKMNNPRINSNGMLITLMNHISELEHLLANENINLHEFQNLILKCKGKAKEESMDIAVEKLKFWVNQVSLLVQERDVLKKENEVEYKNIKQLNKKLEIELSMKTAQHKFLCSDHEVLEETHETLKKNYKKVTDQNEIYKNEVENLKTKLSKLLMEHEGTKQKLENLTFEHQNLSKELYNLEKKRHQEREALKAKENMKENSPLVSENRNYYETVKTKDIESSRSKRSHHLSHEENPEMEVLGKKEDKWKQQRTRAYDSRRSIDLNTICSESTVETCRDCESMKHQLQKMKSEISQIKKDESARSSDLETLKVKYEKLKQLCRIRYEEIQTLQSQQALSRV